MNKPEVAKCPKYAQPVPWLAVAFELCALIFVVVMVVRTACL